MLQPANPQAKECYDLAAEARQRALAAPDEAKREYHLNDERRWLKLARSYELLERLDHFLGRRPDPVHPKCSRCGVPMWLVDFQHAPGDPPSKRWHYECKVCDARLVVASDADGLVVAPDASLQARGGGKASAD
jgi:hypothetical protein